MTRNAPSPEDPDSTGKRLRGPCGQFRTGNIELLRIVCMLLILAHHMVYHSSAMRTSVYGNRVLSLFLFAGGQTGVNCFVLITGYFLAPFKARRLFATLLEALFYSLGLTLLVKWTGWRTDVTDQAVWDSALIVTRSPYWFVTMYLALTSLLPALQPMVKSLGRRAHQWVLALGTLFLCVIPTLTIQRPSTSYFHLLLWFFELYLLGAYFRKFPNRMTRCMPLQGALFVAMIAFIALFSLWGESHLELFQSVASRQNFFADKNTIPQLICSCALFLFFAGLRVPPWKPLLVLSRASFGVYLIHDHNFLRSLLWVNTLQIWQAAQREDYWMTALLAPWLLYLALAAVDLLRQFLLEKPLLQLLDPLFARLDRWIGS